MAAFGPDGFALLKLHNDLRVRNVHDLTPLRSQMHLDTTGIGLILASVFE